ncbi:MAG: hypothetical protein AMS27_03240 [Bacteroides sp. SM23_62_1]|nr:MAG: hypothetical protein AMS27_03240 [Bacteroides sp. SM23_62_1]
MEYYLKLGSNDFQLLKLKKKAVIAIFPDYHENIENFIKDENINLKDEDDLTRLVKFYDGLQE